MKHNRDTSAVQAAAPAASSRPVSRLIISKAAQKSVSRCLTATPPLRMG